MPVLGRMGLLCCREHSHPEADNEENAQTAEIEKRIAQETKAEEHIQKLLLLGAGDSGKSTIFKQVENLSRKAQLQEVELERTTKQLKEAIALASEETAKCKAAKEVIKSLTAQLKDMAERLPVGAGRNSKIPSFVSCTSPVSSDTSAQADRLSSPLSFMVPVSNGSNSILVPNGIATLSNRSSTINKSGHPEAIRNGSKISDVDTNHEAEWVEQDEPGVYITLTSLPGGVKDLKRVRFSRKRFSEKQAEQWWAENRARVYEQYNVRAVDKGLMGDGNDDSSQLTGRSA